MASEEWGVTQACRREMEGQSLVWNLGLYLAPDQPADLHSGRAAPQGISR